ncbi:SCP domain-containing protein, partial [Trichostrongylus colubriformis]
MACRRDVLIFISLFTLIYGEVKVIEINVSKYEGLKSSQLNNREKQKQFYDFQFCMCPRAVQLHSQPWATSRCQCKPTIKGKRVIDSIPYAIFPMSCVSEVNPHNCLRASFKKTNNERVFVKVSIGSLTSVTLPLWQELPLDRMKNSRSLTTGTGTPFKINYDVITYSPFSSKESQVMNVWKPKSMKTSLFNLLFKRNIEEPDFKITSMEKTQRHRVVKAINSAPWTKDDITSVARYTTIQQIREALFRQSLKDRIMPTSFDVRLFKEELTTYHNIFRSRHGAPPLEYDYTLERAAQNWANSLGSRRSCLVHEVPRRYGENLFYFGAKKFPSAHVMAQLITQSFYMEGVGYDYN